MKFDVIIRKCTYQEMDGGAQASASPIYQNFVRAAKELNPKYISLIMPSRWYTGGKGLDSLRDEMLNDEHIRELHDWLTPEDIFLILIYVVVYAISCGTVSMIIKKA